MDLLTKIIESKRQRVEQARRLVLLERVRKAGEAVRREAGAHRLREAMNRDKVNIIGEFKRRSPSKGEINSSAVPSNVARIYESGGAAAISVLTEEDFFAGSLDDLRAIRDESSLPILRKDFIFDHYQIYESAAAGADALLLIVAALDDHTLGRLRRLAEDELGMDALVEVHTEEELDRALNCDARLIGVNNRDLRTFTVSTQISVELARRAPLDALLISESGLTPTEVSKLKAIGYKGFLVGEALMSAKDPAEALGKFISIATASTERIHVKICGITNLEDARAAIRAGADMLGFNFYRASPRYIAAEDAASIIETIRSENSADRRTMVGVFVDEPSPEALAGIAETAGVDAVQLHGDDSIDFCARVKRLLPNVALIKVMRVAEGFEPAQASNFPADAVMLDSFHSELRGGTGRGFDWTVAKQTREIVPRLFLAGGLSAENVETAIAQVHPYAVDACSSLESSPGRKDAERMKEFVRAARGE